MRNAPEVDYKKVTEIIKMDFMPQIKEIIHQSVARSVEEFSARKITRIEALEKYLSLLYEAQRSNHDVHKEIDEALKQFKQEAGI